VWTITSGKEALSAHVTIDPGATHKQVLDSLREELRSRFNIGHVTLQLEPPEEQSEDGVKLYQILRRSDSEADATSSRGSSQSAAARDGKD
jgi:hypothetical protein